MASASALVITVRLAWWLRPYLAALVFLCRLFGTEPNPTRVGYWVSKGIYVKAEFCQQPNQEAA